MALGLLRRRRDKGAAADTGLRLALPAGAGSAG